MAWQPSSAIDDPPVDPIGEAVADTLVEVLPGADVERVYSPQGAPAPRFPDGPAIAVATGGGPVGWQVTLVLRLPQRITPVVESGPTSLAEILAALPGAAVRAMGTFRPLHPGSPRLPATLRRALRDAVAAEVLADYLADRVAVSGDTTELIAETVEFLIELSGTRVESRDLTHGVIITDALQDVPRLRFRYPADVRAAKRAPLLFDGLRSLLVVDAHGRARTELQRHRLERLGTTGRPPRRSTEYSADSGSLVAEATRTVGGLGLFLRADRSIWAFVDGRPLLVRRGERWTAFPLELSAFVEQLIGGGRAAAMVAQAAILVSAQPHGAILAIVEDAESLDGFVSLKDRFDLRNEADPTAMRAETRLHHLIDAEDLDEHTLVRLATLDGATIVDREGRLLAYGAIVASADSQYEGARTAAAKTLSGRARIVLKVSVDGDITVFRGGEVMATLLGGTSA
jgi:hypothetical protein